MSLRHVTKKYIKNSDGEIYSNKNMKLKAEQRHAQQNGSSRNSSALYSDGDRVRISAETPVDCRF
jgi:uncharacterized protein YaiI (UPF0178 family)